MWIGNFTTQVGFHKYRQSTTVTLKLLVAVMFFTNNLFLLFFWSSKHFRCSSEVKLFFSFSFFTYLGSIFADQVHLSLRNRFMQWWRIALNTYLRFICSVFRSFSYIKNSKTFYISTFVLTIWEQMILFLFNLFLYIILLGLLFTIFLLNEA